MWPTLRWHFNLSKNIWKPFFQAQAPHSNLLYSRCLALLLETLLYTHKEDVVSLGHAFNAFNVDVTELRLWIRDLERGHYLKQGVAL